MSPEERQLLTALFDRVRTASATPRDPEAESLIGQAVRDQPYVTYYLAQAVIVQEKGLEAASNRIRELEDHVRQLEAGDNEHRRAEQGGGFLSSIFGSSQPPQPAPVPPSAAAAPSGPWGSALRQPAQPNRYDDDAYRSAPQPAPGSWSSRAMPSAGSSFLGGALGTAAGVAGGMLLANSLSGVFGNHMSSLGLGSPLSGANPAAGEAAKAPVEETVVNNNYYGDDAIREASDNKADNSKDDNPNDGLQQADYNNDYADDQPDFGNDDFGGDDSLNA
jgi:hypothetical protein